MNPKIYAMNFMEFTNQNYNKVLTDAVNGNIPEDSCLKRRLRLPLGCVENSPTEDGTGIRGVYNDHFIDFKVEGIAYIEEVDEETMEYYAAPTLWYAHGNMDGFHVSLIAGSEAHAFAKILQAFYKKANKINPKLAFDMFKGMKWRKHGYCY